MMGRVGMENPPIMRHRGPERILNYKFVKYSLRMYMYVDAHPYLLKMALEILKLFTSLRAY